GPDSLARGLLAASADFATAYPRDGLDADLAWRAGRVAYAHGWHDEAAGILVGMADRHPDDTRRVAALRTAGDARFRGGEFLAAEAIYGRTLDAARAAGQDTLAAAVAANLPLCRYRHAEQLADADPERGPAAAATHFATVGRRWPDFAHADLAWYRAGLGFESAGDDTAAVAAWTQLLRAHPQSGYARDGALKIAARHESAGRPAAAADAYVAFSTTFAADADAAGALLKAAELRAAAGDARGAEALRSDFLRRFPGETAAVLAIHEERAARALAALPPDARPDDDPAIAAYLGAVAAHPDSAAAGLQSSIAYRRAEAARGAYLQLRLTQPLPAAIAAKQAALENVLALYGACAAWGVTEDVRAAAYRTGEVIVHFGDALLASERPAGLAGDDLAAYDEVLAEQSWPFADRGETAWSELLEQSRGAGDDPGGWLARTRESLWPRVAERFLHMPEAEYPLVAAVPPPEPARSRP
ncbi:hypothetical protein KDM41_18195, partial [bacterium]|nr:hypothetical protein [bacterium]